MGRYCKSEDRIYSGFSSPETTDISSAFCGDEPLSNVFVCQSVSPSATLFTKFVKYVCDVTLNHERLVENGPKANIS